jgi:TRAP-type C4-dicarboxylate transport system substrate-binding protein
MFPTEGVRTMKVTTIAILAVALAAAGCGGGDEGGAAKTAEIKPVTLRIGTDDEPGRPAADQIEELARRAAKLSNGAIRIEPVWHAAGDGPDWDQRVARMVTNGELDMGLIPSRSWDTEGVTSLRALNAPFLITSDELLDQVVSSDVAGDLMAGLGKAGVHGLALFPEGLRHPFGLEKPLMGPDDYDGEAIRTPTSETTAAMFGALGASVNDDEADPRQHAAMESSYFLEPGGTATGNVTFYPKVNSLVIADAAYGRLDDAQRKVLAEAAAQTRDWAIEESPTDAEAAEAFCATGQSVVLASDGQLAALEQAAAPVTAELESDEQTASIIESIRALKQDAAAPAAAACGRPARAHSPKFDGVYRFRITDAQLRDAGVTDKADIDENHGVYDITLADGTYCWVQTGPNPVNNPDECSTFEVDGNRIVWHYPVGAPDVYRFTKTASGDLEVEVVKAGTPDVLPFMKVWAANTWKRTGDAE